MMLSSSKQQVLLINISSVAEEMETHYLNICYTNVVLQSLIKQLNWNQWKENWQYTLQLTIHTTIDNIHYNWQYTLQLTTYTTIDNIHYFHNVIRFPQNKGKMIEEVRQK